MGKVPKEKVDLPFSDVPRIEETQEAINVWQRPELPDRLRRLALIASYDIPVQELAKKLREHLANIKDSSEKTWLEVSLIDWLYDFIGTNVKRGRVFELDEVLRQGRADCLGYAKLFTLLGRLFGLDVGVVEAVIDNAGRYVPHTAALVKLSNGRFRLIDLWYGSKNARHKRLGLLVKRDRAWKVEDVELRELGSLDDVSYLPDTYVDGITLYIRGNRHLNRQEHARAIEYYSKALELYPGNARALYNRAVAYDNLGDRQKADADYAQALRNDAAVMRVLAKEYEEIEGLIELDARGISKMAQEIYLLHRGIATGRKVSLLRVARRLGFSEAEVRAILSSIEAKLGESREHR